MSKFLSEEVLNDYISPSQVCIKPTEIVSASTNKSSTLSRENGEDEKEIQVFKEDDESNPNNLNKVSITLDDCLACSGCITSSEEIILEKQSYQVFLKDYHESQKSTDTTMDLLISISPQCRVSLCEYFEMGNVKKFDIAFINVLNKLFPENCKYIVSTQIGGNIVISENNRKVEEYKNAEMLKKQTDDVKHILPKLTSVCPGVVMYIEKTHPTIVDYFIDTKSPVSITGNLIKRGLNMGDGDGNTKKLYHLSIMPCFDKKLEAVKTKDDIECVITPKEFVNMLIDLGIDFHKYTNVSEEYVKDNYQDIVRKYDPFQKILSTEENINSLSLNSWAVAQNGGSSSGGFAYQYILNRFMKLNDETPNDGDLYRIDTVIGKNSDIREYRITEQVGNKTVCSASEVYGFRNIQNIIRKYEDTLNNKTVKKRRGLIVKRRKPVASTDVVTELEKSQPPCDPLKSDIIEIMACPGGCINGGGLIYPKSSDISSNNSRKKTQYISHLNAIYHSQMDTTDGRLLEIPDDVLGKMDLTYTFNKLDVKEGTAATTATASSTDPTASLFSTW